ncbi:MULTISPECIES: CHASE3 domain-containing protein [unclassified Bradyrhizobium]|uniref:sensor histidine kinase n=1 Tax=unclassified Bradyrhizobium TaxID=2631580 RepID=UPI0003764F41|nr:MULTISPECIES: CHASE3 domain-containing protein [unclassified Bradyrhizobium]MCK1273477.1 CHASE3 domain-containing protein [Bradyrhizobium sp. 84]MCK1323249.1 CHASE3 domain-containing protein [Bradyrhizobium sp. 156]MCK1346211.1 CHASE3 domain-containing protein [Bradyrhizobium sp. CW11]MCK1354541.1 CHASE3 domain-containing protein [Bradyrhizobium sp. CW7]MCK1376179.1 CHASE3 domain-containing protein [Bradyrhizobium sp. 49]MCK1415791.1 CHASE3 domain-containing protein [Bradyrhizobium sp. CW4
MIADAQRRRRFWQILLFAAGLMVLTVISAGSVYLVNKARDDSKWVIHTIEAENQINALLLEIRRAESTARGYLLTQGEDFKVDHDKAVAAIVPALDRLTRLIGDNPEQRQSIEKLSAAIETRLGQFVQEMDFIRRGEPEKAAALVREIASTDTTAAIANVATGMIQEEERLFRLRTVNSDRSQTLAASMTGIGSGLVVLLALISIWLVRRSALARDDAEARLRDANVNLEGVVDERTADLREANNEIQRFAYIVSHDLRSPLVNIMGFTSELEELGGDIFRRIGSLTHVPADGPPLPDGEIALEGPDKQLSEDFSEALGFIKSSIAKMDRLISAILNLTREGRREFQPEKIDTRELIEAIVSTLAHQAAEAQAEIHVAPLPDLVSDRLALEQIFSNLIDNAIKYLKPGVPGEIRIRGRTKLGYAIFEISDNGRGIDAKDHQRIFDLFRRAGTQDKPGQGIGLAHVRALVRRLGGTMSVSSELNTGSTFTITLPITWNASNRNADQ